MLLVKEIYPTILGESRYSGQACVVLRLTGCHRRCSYCDTAYAFEGGESLSTEEAYTRILRPGFRTVLVTGGEPLLQKDVLPLMGQLLRDGLRVVLETSGTRGAEPLSSVPAGVCRVVDVKTPGSGIKTEQIAWDQLAALGPEDDLKFVLCDRRDYEWARDIVREAGRLPAAPARFFSGVHGQLPPHELAAWILGDRLDVRLQVQLHKHLWPDRDRGI